MLQSLCSRRMQPGLLAALATMTLFTLVIMAYNSASLRTSVLRWTELRSGLTAEEPLSARGHAALRRCLNGVVTVAPGGRFGNAFMEVASAWAVARAHNLTLATPTDLRNRLLHAFRRAPLGLSLAELLAACPAHAPTAPARAAGGRERPLSEADVLLLLRMNTTDIPAAATALAAALAADPAAVPGPLVMPRYVVLAQYVIPYADEIRAQVEWQDDLRAKAQEKLRLYGKTTADIVGEPAETVIFVGIHVRRTDYPQWLRQRAKTNLEADASFYSRAVAHLRRELDDPAVTGDSGGTGGAAGPLALVVVSDDMPWVRSTLLPELNTLAHTAGRMAAFAGGDGHESSALQDLALLAACNHTVFAYGTYGMTAALLTGGRVVAFQLTRSYPTSQAVSLDPRWTVLR